MSEHNLGEFEYSRGDLRIRLKKPSAGVPMYTRSMGVPEIIVPGATERQPPASQSAAAASPEPRATEDLHLVKSPIVGTYYEAPSPGAEGFVKIGAHVESGQTLCIVEAMILMNEIESGRKRRTDSYLCRKRAACRKYGQPLFGIRPSRKKR